MLTRIMFNDNNNIANNRSSSRATCKRMCMLERVVKHIDRISNISVIKYII